MRKPIEENTVKAYYGSSVKFDDWDISKTKEFGYHFAVGNDAASKHRINTSGGHIYEVEINYSKPLRMKDARYWDLRAILAGLKQGSRYADLKRQAVIAARKNFSSLRVEENLIAAKILDEAGYDAIEYDNDGEAGGDAIIIWNPTQILKLRAENNNSRGATMKITESQLRRVIRETMEILNADSGELITIDRLPPKYSGRLTKVDSGGSSYDALYDSDFESLRQDIKLDPDEALDMLGELISDDTDHTDLDLDVAIDLAMGYKHSYPDEWKAACKTSRVHNMYLDDLGDDEDAQFQSIDDALARWLAERYT